MQDKLIREAESEDASEISITVGVDQQFKRCQQLLEPQYEEGISSPIAQHILDFCDDGGAADLFHFDGPSSLPIGSVDMPIPYSTADANSDAADTAFENFKNLDPASVSALFETPIPSDLPSDQPQHQLQPQTQQQPVPSINFNNFLPRSTQSYNTTNFSPKKDNQTKSTEDMSNPVPQFLMPAPSTSMMQVGPVQIQQQGTLMGLENTLLQLHMIQPNTSDRQRFFPSNSSSNALAISELERMSPFSGGVPQPLRRIFSSGDLQIRGSQNVMAGCSDSTNSTPALASTEPTTTALEESSSYKVGRLTQEERRAKIDRYIRKRNERNFKKKIKYACRKTLADSRPRVRGRFAKNDEFEEPTRRAYNNGPYEDEGTSPMVMVKEHGDVLDSSDILAHISEVNPYNLTYSSSSCGPSWAT